MRILGISEVGRMSEAKEGNKEDKDDDDDDDIQVPGKVIQEIGKGKKRVYSNRQLRLVIVYSSG